MTRIPRSGLAHVPGEAEHGQALPVGLPTALRGLAAQFDVPPSTLLLAAHAHVVSVLVGEDAVTVGRVVGGRLLSCRLTVAASSWCRLVREAADPAATAGTRVETAVDEHCPGTDLPASVVLRLGWSEGCGRLLVRYRTEAIDARYASRLAEYHVAALARLVTDLGVHRLVAAEEIRPRIGAPAGPGRESPDLEVHELFEGHVRAHPRTLATIEGERSWTYAQLNTRANRLASVLLARGLVPGEAVAVVTERNLEWLAAVLGVFKAGGAYLPLDPRFPADRIATLLWRSGCRLAVTQAESGEALEAARADLAASGDGGEIDVLDLELLDVDISDPDNLDVEAGPDRLAYLCPTDAGDAGGRGCTGEPEGTPDPHVYRLNHVLTKIEELGIGPGDVVAQTAPQCLDVSLWQMVAALCAGGRTLIVGQETLLDAELFVDTIERGAVTILQVSPAQLKAVLEHLDAYPRPLPHLRYVCATGEGLEIESAGHRFAAHGVHIAQAGRCPPPGGRSVPHSPGPVPPDPVRQCPMDPVDPTERLPDMRYPFVAAPPAVVRHPDTPPATVAQPDTTSHGERALDREGDR